MNYFYELTGLRGIYINTAFILSGDRNRHPQGRVITVAYYAMIRLSGGEGEARVLSQLVIMHPKQSGFR